jgi:hypothetical protein
MLFVFRLARELGYTVGRLYEELDSLELAQWQAVARIENEEREEKQKKNKDTAIGARLESELRGYSHDAKLQSRKPAD